MINDFETAEGRAITPGGFQQQGQEVNAEPAFTLPPIAGFWRRFFAWVLDSLLLGAIGQGIGFIFSPFFFNLGPYGRLIGLLFILPYFGIFNSKIGGGQTIGKRLMKIAVRNKNNEPIDLWRSVIRVLILSLPPLLNTWQVPIFRNMVVSWLATLLIFGLGGAILYTMIFNKKARQGIHDLIVGSYVVYLPGEPVASFPVTARIHWLVSAVLVGVMAVVSLAFQLIGPALLQTPLLSPVVDIYNALEKDPRFFTVNVNRQTTFSNRANSGHYLIITVWCKGRPGESTLKEMSDSIAKIAFEYGKNIDQYDGMQIMLTSAYDIGIASFNTSRTFFNTIDDWRKEVGPISSLPVFPAFLWLAP